MTTFQGLPGEKSSSRVLRPPGGGDSNIFGSDNPPEHTHRKMAPQPPSNNIFGPATSQNPPPRNKEDTGDNIFGNPASDQQTPVKSTEQNHQNKEKGEENIQKSAQNNNDEPSLAQSAKSYAKRMQQVIINTITGERMGVTNSRNEMPSANPVRIAIRNPITGKDMGVTDYHEKTVSTNKVKIGSYNPITGEGGQDAAGAKSRVRQPPGGFSSKLW